MAFKLRSALRRKSPKPQSIVPRPEPPYEEDTDGQGARMSFFEHLEELRTLVSQVQIGHVRQVCSSFSDGFRTTTSLIVGIAAPFDGLDERILITSNGFEGDYRRTYFGVGASVRNNFWSSITVFPLCNPAPHEAIGSSWAFSSFWINVTTHRREAKNGVKKPKPNPMKNQDKKQC